MSDVLDLVVEPGLPFYKTFQYATNDGVTNTPVPLSNAKLTMEVRHSPKNPTVLFKATEEDYLVVSDSINGEFSLNIPEEVVNSFKFNHATYDVVIQLDNQIPDKLIGGLFTVKPLTTRG